MTKDHQQNRINLLRRRFFEQLTKNVDFQNKVKALRGKYKVDTSRAFLGVEQDNDLLICHPQEFIYLKDPIAIKQNENFYEDAKKLCEDFNLSHFYVDVVRRYVLIGDLGLPPKNKIDFRRGTVIVTVGYDVSEKKWREFWREIQDVKRKIAKSGGKFNFGIKPKLSSKDGSCFETILWFWRKKKDPKIKIPSTIESAINQAANSVKQGWRNQIKEWEEVANSESPINPKD